MRFPKSIALFSLALSAVGELHAQPDTTINIAAAASYSFCYTNSTDTMITYVNAYGMLDPIAMNICGGYVDPCCAMIVVFDGTDEAGPVLYAGTGSDGDMSDLYFISSTPDHALTLHIVSEGTGSCATSGYVPLTWAVDGVGPEPPHCFVTGIPEMPLDPPMLFPNPASEFVNVGPMPMMTGPVQLMVSDIQGRVLFESTRTTITGANTVIDLHKLENGIYQLRMSDGTHTRSSSFVLAH